MAIQNPGPSRQGDGIPRHAQPVLSLHSHLILLLSQTLVELPSCLSYISGWTVGTGDLKNHVRPLPIWGLVLRPHKKLLQADVWLENDPHT